MGNFGPWELILILVVALIVVGPGKLPEMAKGMGKAVNEFKKASTGMQEQFVDALRNEQTASQVEPEIEKVATSNNQTVSEPVEEPDRQCQEPVH